MASEVQAAPATYPRSLSRSSVFYGGMVCIAGVLGNKQVALGPLAVEAGIFAFLLLVVTSSSVAELHGRATANRLVLFGFVPLLVSLALSVVVLSLPASPQMDPARLSSFETVMSGTPRIWLGGILAYGISTFLNVTIFSRLKASEGRHLLWLRAGDRECAQPGGGYAHLHHRRILRRLPDRRADRRPDASEGRAFGCPSASVGLCFRRAGPKSGCGQRLTRSR